MWRRNLTLRKACIFFFLQSINSWNLTKKMKCSMTENVVEKTVRALPFPFPFHVYVSKRQIFSEWKGRHCADILNSVMMCRTMARKNRSLKYSTSVPSIINDLTMINKTNTSLDHRSLINTINQSINQCSVSGQSLKDTVVQRVFHAQTVKVFLPGMPCE